jgi:acetoin:2,6-dichlorophenolindophenol oxidoreductase subunit alpha
MAEFETKELLSLYRTMLRIRSCEESLVEPILNGEVRCPCHLYSGEEAVAAGLCACLTQEDPVFGNHRSHGHYLAKGGSMDAMVAEIFGRETGCCRGRGGSMHLIDPENGVLGVVPVVAGTISLALGAALASSIRGDRRVTVTFFGDGATGEGVLYESMNFAALKRLPLIFACENNLYATHMPVRECRVDRPIFQLAGPLGLAARQVDGNDVLAVREAGREAVEACRRGEGPVFLEFLTYRYRGHVGPDDNIQGSHTDIRPPEEVQAWLDKDPLVRFENTLRERFAVGEAALEEIRRAVLEEVQNALAFARRSSLPEGKDLEKYVFAA